MLKCLFCCGVPWRLEAGDVENLCFGDTVVLLVGAEVGDPDVLPLENAPERFEDAEAGAGAVGLPEHAEVEQGNIELLGRAEVGEGAEGLLDEPGSLLVVAL